MLPLQIGIACCFLPQNFDELGFFPICQRGCIEFVFKIPCRKICVALCYQGPLQPAPVNFSSNQYVAATVEGGVSRQPFSASGSVAPGGAAATYAVGLCAAGTVNLDSNDYVNGWVIVSQ